MKRDMYERFLKRVLDAVGALLLLALLSPALLALAACIRIDSKGPVIFTQKRVGKDKRTFRVLKFRTMRMDAPKDVPTHLLGDSRQFITRMGHFLRLTSLDELPQLWNILMGEMSFVGPRPALWNQDDLVAERDRYGANSVRPGLTGWAQINGRDELPIPVKAKLDGDYVRRMSFAFDVRCCLMTVGKVIRHEGVQ